MIKRETTVPSYVLEDIYSVDYLKLKKILINISNKSKYKKDATFNDLYSLLENPIILMQALGKISPNKGASTPGIDQETLDKMQYKKIENLSNSLKNKTFYFKPVKRVFIPKLGKNKLRPLGIPTFSDRIVQEAIRIILETIYEPIFENHRFQNFGFRPNKSCHDAMNYLKEKGTACNYAIEGDIKGAYDNVDHDILIKILRKKIKDEKFIQLIKQGCKCGIIQFKKFEETQLGVPQGGIASPILFNIYMNEFDTYINNELQEIIEKYNINNGRSESKLIIRNKEYHNLEGKIAYRNKQIKLIIQNKQIKTLNEIEKTKLMELFKSKKQLNNQRIKTPSINKNKRSVRIIYVRYADDFIILLNSKLKFSEELKEKLRQFLINELKLELSIEKTKITCIKTNYAKFLGFTLFTYHNTKLSRNEHNDLIRTGGYNIKIGIDTERVLQRLYLKGFCNKKFKPLGKRAYSVLSIKEIITKYNSIIRGLANYYIPIIDALRPFTQIQYILEYSCYGTISTKFKTSIFKLMKNYGKPPIFEVQVEIKKRGIEIENKTLKFKINSYKENVEFSRNININKQSLTKDPFEPMKKINWRTYKNLNAACCICGSTTDIEWHHVKAIKIGKVSGFTQVMKQLNRKTVPVCHQHHVEITQGKYNDIKISDLFGINYWLA